MKKKVMTIGLGMLFGLAATALAQTEVAKKLLKHSSISYRLEIATEGEPAMAFDYQEQGGKSRLKVEGEEAGKKKTTAEMLQTGDASYLLNSEEKIAIKFSKESGMAGMMFPFMWMVVEPDWLSYQAAHQQGYTITDKGSETIRGQTCKVKEIANLQTKDKVLIYISGDSMIRRWVILPGQSQQKKATMDLINLEFDKKIADSTFQVPAGFQVQDMSNMPMGPGMGMPPAQKQP